MNILKNNHKKACQSNRHFTQELCDAIHKSTYSGYTLFYLVMYTNTCLYTKNTGVRVRKIDKKKTQIVCDSTTTYRHLLRIQSCRLFFSKNQHNFTLSCCCSSPADSRISISSVLAGWRCCGCCWCGCCCCGRRWLVDDGGRCSTPLRDVESPDIAREFSWLAGSQLTAYVRVCKRYMIAQCACICVCDTIEDDGAQRKTPTPSTNFHTLALAAHHFKAVCLHFHIENCNFVVFNLFGNCSLIHYHQTTHTTKPRRSRKFS